MARLFFAVNYDTATILDELKQDGWEIVPDEEWLVDRPICYRLYQTSGAETWADLYPTEPPYFSFVNASDSDADLVDRFDCIGENDFHEMRDGL